MAAVFYVVNLREVRLNRRISLTKDFILPIASKEGISSYFTVMNMEWTDFDDFFKKYSRKVDPQYAIAFQTYHTTCEVLGFQYKRGLIDLETVYEMCGEYIIEFWLKFKPVMEEFIRSGRSGKDVYNNFEYLAYQLAKIKNERDPTFPPIQKFFNQ